MKHNIAFSVAFSFLGDFTSGGVIVVLLFRLLRLPLPSASG